MEKNKCKFVIILSIKLHTNTLKVWSPSLFPYHCTTVSIINDSNVLCMYVLFNKKKLLLTAPIKILHCFVESFLVLNINTTFLYM